MKRTQKITANVPRDDKKKGEKNEAAPMQCRQSSPSDEYSELATSTRLPVPDRLSRSSLESNKTVAADDVRDTALDRLKAHGATGLALQVVDHRR